MFDSFNPLSSRAPVAFPHEDSWLSAIVADYRRAVKAAQRYEWLRRRQANLLARKGIHDQQFRQPPRVCNRTSTGSSNTAL